MSVDVCSSLSGSCSSNNACGRALVHVALPQLPVAKRDGSLARLPVKLPDVPTSCAVKLTRGAAQKPGDGVLEHVPLDVELGMPLLVLDSVAVPLRVTLRVGVTVALSVDVDGSDGDMDGLVPLLSDDVGVRVAVSDGEADKEGGAVLLAVGGPMYDQRKAKPPVPLAVAPAP